MLYFNFIKKLTTVNQLVTHNSYYKNATLALIV